MDKYKICTLIVTYNRKELLLKCVRKCLEQSIETDILIFDNHSTDGTREYLEKQGLLNNRHIIYHYNPQNIGGAGGFSKGIKMAFEREYDFYWIMDDDGYPYQSDCLEQSLTIYKKFKSKRVIVNALVVGSDLQTLSFHTGGYTTKEELINHANDDFFMDAISPFNGTLYSKKTIQEVGYPREDFFIKGDETEFTCRAKKKGYECVTAIQSIFIHPIMPQNIQKIFGKEIDLGEEVYWKEYYKARNYIYIYSTYYSRRQLLKHICFSLIKYINYKDDIRRKRKFTLRGIKDGLKNDFSGIDIG